MNTDPLIPPADDLSTISTVETAPGSGVVIDDTSKSQAAEMKREEAWRTRQDWTFLGKPLEPWGMGRESLFARLVEADVSAEALENIELYELHLNRAKEEAAKIGTLSEVEHLTVEDMVNPLSLLCTAAKVLYLAAHKPEHWDRFRGREMTSRFIREIEEWTEKAIPPEIHWEAILLARDVRAQHKALVAVRRPYPGGRNQVGN